MRKIVQNNSEFELRMLNIQGQELTRLTPASLNDVLIEVRISGEILKNDSIEIGLYTTPYLPLSETGPLAVCVLAAEEFKEAIAFVRIGVFSPMHRSMFKHAAALETGDQSTKYDLNFNAMFNYWKVNKLNEFTTANLNVMISAIANDDIIDYLRDVKVLDLVVE